MKKTPFPQAQTLDSQGVLHEWHGPVHNLERRWNSVDKALKCFADSCRGAAAADRSDRKIQPLSRFGASRPRNPSSRCGAAATTAVAAAANREPRPDAHDLAG